MKRRRSAQKRRTRRRRLIILLILLALLLFWPRRVSLEGLISPEAVLMDADSGEVLAAKNADASIYPASMTKVMTALLVLEANPDLDTPVTLPEVKYHQWICDEAGLLSEKTKEEIQQYNSDWDSRYYAAVAVATVDSITGWPLVKAAEKLGADWGLGENDMLLLLVRNGDYYVNCGDKVRAAMTDTQQMKLKQAIETPYYNGDFDRAALAFY